ncbi:MAG: efflux RND transporter periplasmic adaptor subunit [Candidatus Moranbacteria bacterium]|nr:efflux RND transporter periplasmic adaptor subunit [Candidatus Moranbacteria bacterium]
MKKSLSKKQSVTLTGVIALAIILSTWNFLKVQGANEKTKRNQPSVKTTLVKEADKNTPLKISGFVRGENRADIAPAVSGTVLQVLKKEGDTVKKGHILAIIKSEQTDAQIAAANSGISALTKTLSDSKKYYDQLVDQAKEARDANPSDSADEAVQSAQRQRDLQIQGVKNQLIAAQGSLDINKTAKNNFIITSPFAGTITNLYVREGGFANFSMPLFSLSTPNNLEIETYLSASDARKVSIGDIATFETEKGVLISATVVTVSAGSDSSNFKTLVRLSLDNSAGLIRLGDFLHGQIMTVRKDQAVSIPKNSIVSRGGDQIVFVLDEKNIAKQQLIKVGSEYAGFVEVSEGLSINQRIVTSGQQYLINGITTKPDATN